MEYIRQVKSNIKGGVDRELGLHTVLVGPNGSGKSSVVQAIQLAADGAIRDGEGRDSIKDFAAIARFFPSGERALFSTLILSNDNRRHWEVKRSGKSWKSGKPEADFEVIFPFEEVKSVLAKSDKEVRAWLSAHILGEMTLDTVCAVLTDQQAELVRRLVREEHCEIDWNVLSTAAKKKATALRRRATIKEKTVDQLTEGVSTPLSPAEKQALGSRSEEIATLLSQSHERKQSEKEQLARTLEEQRVQLANARAEMETCGSEGGMSADEFKLITGLREILIAHITHFGTENCMVCRNTDIEEALTKQVKIVEEGVLAGKTQQRLSYLRGLEARLAERLAELQAAYDSFVVTDLSELRIELRQIQDKLAGDVASRRAWDNVKVINTEVYQMRSEADSLTAAAGTLAKVGLKRLKAGMEGMVSEVSSWLPEGVRLGVDLDAGRLGFLRESGSLHTGLPGGEWTTMVMALGCYVMSKSGPYGVPVLTPDDRGWDPDTLSRVMEAVQSYSGQVIIMSTVAPSTPPDGWTIVQL